EVGHQPGDDRRRARAVAPAPTPAAVVHRRLGEDRPRARAATRHGRRALRPVLDARSHPRAEPRARGSAQPPPAAVAQRQAPESALRRADPRAAAALPHLRQRSGARHARLWLLGRERAARALRPRGRTRVDRLRSALVRFLVAGAGSWGTAFAHVLLEREHEVVLACHTAEQARAIAETGRNQRYIPHVDLRQVEAVPLEAAPADVDVVVVAVPSKAFAEVVRALPGEAPVLSLTKGLDPATGERLSTRVQGRSVAVLSGPNMAEEIAVEMPTAAVIASEDGYLAGRLQHAINSTVFRAYVNQDVVGVELCAAAKNVIALAAGGVDGLDLGDNSKAALITRGLAEMARLGEAAGARPETFAGLAGMGDLIVTCWSRHGRNRHAGELIAQGLSPGDAATEIGTVEGLTTAPVLRDLSHRLKIELPITEGVCMVLDGKDLNELAASLMGREPTRE